jgi:hypothetical protein
MKGRLWGQASLFMGAVGQTGVGLYTGEFEKWLKWALEVGHISLSLSVRALGREGGSFAGNPGG